MKRETSLILILYAMLACLPLSADENIAVQEHFQEMFRAPGETVFTPPDGWKLVDPKVLSPHIKYMVVGSSKGDFPPSLNLAFDPFKGTLKDYLKMVKKYNDSIGAEWKDLGMIQTEAGPASLSQVDTVTKWGKERQMQVIFLHEGNAWIVTASALKEEYPHYYKEFFRSMKSLRINPELPQESEK